MSFGYERIPKEAPGRGSARWTVDSSDNKGPGGGKKRGKTKKRKKGRIAPVTAGPEGAPHPHRDADDFDPRAHRGEYPEADRDVVDPRASSN